MNKFSKLKVTGRLITTACLLRI